MTTVSLGRSMPMVIDDFISPTDETCCATREERQPQVNGQGNSDPIWTLILVLLRYFSVHFGVRQLPSATDAVSPAPSGAHATSWLTARATICGLKGELLQPFWPGKPGAADAPFGAPTGAVVAFSDHQLRQKPQIGQLLTLGGGGDLSQPVASSRQAQQALPC